jgi:hypothetical protein
MAYSDRPLNFATEYERDLHAALDHAVNFLRQHDQSTAEVYFVEYAKRLLARALPHPLTE